MASTSWVYSPATTAALGPQQGVGRPASPSAPHVACPFPGLQPRQVPLFHPSRGLPYTPHTQASVGSAATPPQLRTPVQPLQLEDSFGTGTMTSAVSSIAVTPTVLGVALRPSPAASCMDRATAGQETVLPSAEEPQLHSLISRLRVALGTKESAITALGQQLSEAQRQLVACDVERRGLHLQLLERQATAAASAGSSGSPAGHLLSQLREELGRQVQSAAEAMAECDALRLQVSALQSQLDATAQVDTQVRCLDVVALPLVMHLLSA
jgi:hypothetical protein